jgi:hypothetical protein
MNAGVGPSGSGNLRWFLEELAQTPLELPAHRAARSLQLKAEERRTVIFDGTANGLR